MLVHQSFTRPGDPPATITICTDPVDGGLDSYAVTGECPGPSCETAVVDPLPPEATEALWVAASGD